MGPSIKDVRQFSAIFDPLPLSTDVHICLGPFPVRAKTNFEYDTDSFEKTLLKISISTTAPPIQTPRK